MSDRKDDEDDDADDISKIIDTRVRQTFLRADYDVDTSRDRRAFAEDMTWVRGHKKYTTLRSTRRYTALAWVAAAVGTLVIGQYIPMIPFAKLLKLLGN